MIKYRLMLTTLPVTLLVVLIKVILEKGFHYNGLVDFSEIGLVITGGIFLIGFMLAGTLSDYKESEKIPADMACSIESLEDTVSLAHRYKSDFDLDAQKKQINEVTVSILRYFAHEESEDIVFEKIKGLTSIAILVENTNIGSTSSWVKREQANLRALFLRATVIKRTSFIATGYAFLNILTVIIIGLLLISKFDNLGISIILVSFFTQIFVYMVRLIKDIDQPFEYPVDGKVQAADIDLFPLIECDRRAKGRLL